MLRAIARAQGCTLSRAAGVYAALSPRTDADHSLDWTAYVLKGKTAGVGGIKSNVDKALLIARGARPLDVLSGRKVTAFYRALMGDRQAVVLDSHVINYLMGHTRPSTNVPRIHPRVYQELEDELKRRARRAGLPPADFQARIWLRQKRRLERDRLNGGPR